VLVWGLKGLLSRRRGEHMASLWRGQAPLGVAGACERGRGRGRGPSRALGPLSHLTSGPSEASGAPPTGRYPDGAGKGWELARGTEEPIERGTCAGHGGPLLLACACEAVEAGGVPWEGMGGEGRGKGGLSFEREEPLFSLSERVREGSSRLCDIQSSLQFSRHACAHARRESATLSPEPRHHAPTAPPPARSLSMDRWIPPNARRLRRTTLERH